MPDDRLARTRAAYRAEPPWYPAGAIEAIIGRPLMPKEREELATALAERSIEIAAIRRRYIEPAIRYLRGAGYFE